MKTTTKTTGIILLILAVILAGAGALKAQSPGWTAVKGTVGATAAMYGAAAAAGACTVVTVGLCGAVVGAVALGGIAALTNMFPPPPIDITPPDPSQMPDFYDPVGSGSDEDCSGAGAGFSPLCDE